MSTSFNETASQIITNTLSLLGVVAAGETYTSNDYVLCLSLLNQMVKAWMAQGIHLWTEKTGTLYLVNGQAAYKLYATNASGTNDECSNGSGTPVETSLSATAVLGASTISLTTTVGMSSGDNIGIQLNDNTIQWTTINGAPTSTTCSLTNVLTAAATSGNQVFTYTTQCPRVLSIQSARLRNSSGFDRIIAVVPRDTYNSIPQKAMAGDPIILSYSPQLTYGIIYLWQTPNDVSKRIEFTYLAQLADFNNSTDTADFPQEWLECIVYNLAVRAAPAYGISLSSGGVAGNPDILRQAKEYLEDLKAWDAEQAWVSIVPPYRFQ